MGVVQAKAERVPTEKLAEWVESQNLNKEQTDRLRSHLMTVRRLKHEHIFMGANNNTNRHHRHSTGMGGDSSKDKR